MNNQPQVEGVMKFPNLLHIVIEEYENSDADFVVCKGGVEDVEKTDQGVALYKLVQTGHVAINKRFVPASRRRKS